MREHLKFYVDGQWVDPVHPAFLDVENPATEDIAGRIAIGSAVDVDRAVKAARRAFASWSRTSIDERIDLFETIVAEFEKRAADIGAAITEEMGAPAALANGPQTALAPGHFATAIEILKTFPFEEQRGVTRIVREPIGVCGLITPWNWPIALNAAKIVPALATGCTVILKPSELAPFSAHILAEVLHAAGAPPGVFNLVYGDGPGVGAAMSSHPDIDMISFTGSVRAGAEVARDAAPTIKRVTQELGGKSAHIVLDDAGLAQNVAAGVKTVMDNSGQTCSAPTRMLAPAARMAEVISVARETASQLTVGDPRGNFALGPLVSKAQYDKVQRLIQKGLDEGATLVAGGLGRPNGLTRGHYAKPTVFADVTNDMTIAREEIFGPVLAILGYDDIDHAIAIANDSEYGLAGYVSGADLDRAREVARRIRAGWIIVNGGFDFHAPFGGYKKSGNGREWGEFGFHEYLEIKAIVGWA
ncbi:MAG: aldehyde dehydrogenase family protein [Hyphomonadaceae bacterium]|nr:aldehyde dehydrogenase family protein [Hyphomonadaceae bacterium]GIK47948.1 MAG: aldehyde dehydrogenase [Alphaproteobacteria bacterium]